MRRLIGIPLRFSLTVDGGHQVKKAQTRGKTSEFLTVYASSGEKIEPWYCTVPHLAAQFFFHFSPINLFKPSLQQKMASHHPQLLSKSLLLQTKSLKMTNRFYWPTSRPPNRGRFTSTPGIWIPTWPPWPDLSATAAPENSSACPPALARSTQSSSKENELTAEKSTEGGKWNYCIVGPTHAKRKHNVPPLFGVLVLRVQLPVIQALQLHLGLIWEAGRRGASTQQSVY